VTDITVTALTARYVLRVNKSDRRHGPRILAPA